MDSTLFLCKLWKITRKPQDSILNIGDKNRTYLPEFPQQPSGKFYVFGTAISRSQNGTGYHNSSCGATIYWRSATVVNSQVVDKSAETKPRIDGNNSVIEDRNYWYLDDNRNRLVVISQAEYDARTEAPLTNTNLLELKELPSFSCNDVGDNDRIYADSIAVTELIYQDQSDKDKIANFNDAFTPTSVDFKLGQESTNYNVTFNWIQTSQNSSYNEGEAYESDPIMGMIGKITNIEVFIENNEYRLQITHNSGNSVSTAAPLINGSTIKAIDDSGAEARNGIYGIKCTRADNAEDLGGNRPEQSAMFTEEISPICCTDFDTPIFFEGLEYVPYFGGSGSNIEKNINANPINSDLEIALALSGITEKDLLSGLYHDAEVVCHTYNWANHSLYYQNYVGYITNIEIVNSATSAYKFTISIDSVLSKIQRKEYNVIGTKCANTFGDAKCGVNLITEGHMDELEVVNILDDLTIQTNSTQAAKNHYERIEYAINGVIYSYEVAAYDPDFSTIKMWTSFALSDLPVGYTIYAIARCSRTTSDCKKYQGNLFNFNGFSEVPKESYISKIRTPETESRGLLGSIANLFG